MPQIPSDPPPPDTPLDLTSASPAELSFDPRPEPPLTPPLPAAPEESELRVGTLTYTRRTLVRLFSWLLWGDFAWSVRDRVLGPVLGLVLKNLQASDKVIGLLSGTIPSAIGLALGPIISYRSDRHRGRRGRRIPFLLISAPAAAVSVIGLGFGPALGGAVDRALGAHSPGPHVLALVFLGLWWVAFDFAATVTNAVWGALINDTVPHGVIGRFYGLFRAVSLLVAIIFNYFLIGPTEAHFEYAFIGVGLIYGIGIVLMCLNVREGDYPPPPPEQQGSALGRFLLATRGYFRHCFTKPYYLWVFAANNLAVLSTSPVNGFTGAFVKSVGMSTKDYGWYNATSYVVSLSLSYVLGSLADRWHPLRLSMVAVTVYIVVMPFVGYFAVTPATFGVALLVHAILSGTYYTVSASITQRLLPQKEYAQFASANGIIAALCNIVLPVALGTVLDHYHHDYRLTFYVGSGIGFLGLICLAVTHHYWKQYGGLHHYVAPD